MPESVKVKHLGTHGKSVDARDPMCCSTRSALGMFLFTKVLLVTAVRSSIAVCDDR